MVLKKAEIAISRDGKGAWHDNVFVERLWRSIKYGEVYFHVYKTVSEARVSIGRYLSFYNSRLPHSSLDRHTPNQALLQRAGTNDGGGIIEAGIHLAKRPKLVRQTEPCVDGPVFASGKSKFRCGRVQPCVRPRCAAHIWPRALMKSADWIPITSTRTKRLARKGCPNPRFDRFVINTQSSCKPLREDMPRMWIGVTQPSLRRIASGSARPRRCVPIYSLTPPLPVCSVCGRAIGMPRF
ncbi:hypothetical protein GGE29_004372 [Agrobacterium tumefaciens]|nr:hypothetical protein [Agrobacterium radiobacter]MBB4454412.1 hypothetical protein [Agrobacterium radiobacter]